MLLLIILIIVLPELLERVASLFKSKALRQKPVKRLLANVRQDIHDTISKDRPMDPVVLCRLHNHIHQWRRNDLIVAALLAALIAGLLGAGLLLLWSR